MEQRKYTLLDVVRLPFRTSALSALMIAVAKVLSALVPTSQLLLTAAFVDGATAMFAGEKTLADMTLPIILLVLMTIGRYCVRSLEHYGNALLKLRVEQKIRGDMTEKRSRMAYRYVEDNQTWELIKRVTKDPVKEIVVGYDGLLGFVYTVVSLGGVLIVIASVNVWIPLAFIAVGALIVRIAIQAGKRDYKAFKEAEECDRRSGYLFEQLTGRASTEERALFGWSEGVEKQWRAARDKARRIWLICGIKRTVSVRGSGFLVILLCGGVTAALIPAYLADGITLGVFTAIVAAIFDQINYIANMVPWHFYSATRSIEYMKDLTSFAALEEQEGADDLPQPIKDFRFERLEFSNVSFRYPGTERWILKDFNLVMDGCRHFAFVGVNGAGKTTITKLLTGLYPEYEGTIYLNGRDLRSYSLAQRKAIFSVAYQDFAKYYITARENIALGKANGATDEEIDRAAHLAGLDEAIGSLPNGLDTPLGRITEGGVDLSGGQWQRFAIARTVIADAPMSILDEPTAALDPLEESRVYELFGEISRNRATIFITHRLGAARLADEIIVLDGGKVVEQGSHDALMRQGGLYAEMFESQRSWYE